MCHKAKEQGTFPLLSVRLANYTSDICTSVLSMHFEKSSLHSDRIRGRKLNCNKSREGTDCLGFNLRRAFKIRALRSGDKAAFMQEWSVLVPSLGSSTAELAVACPGT